MTRAAEHSLVSLLKINEICEAFEESWLGDSPHRIEELLDSVEESERGLLLKELLLLELSYSLASGRSPDIVDYMARFSGHQEIVVNAFSRIRLTGDTISTERFTGTDLAPGTTFREGDRVSQYTIKQKLGRGAYGDVYLVHRDESSAMLVLKILKRPVFGPRSGLGSLPHEAKVIRQLEYPGILPVRDTGDHQGRPFFVTEYEPGETFRDAIRMRKLTVEQSIELLAEVASILAYVHQRDIFHCDLKPTNILVGRDEKPRLIDFGLATHEHSRWEHENERFGTLAYMAPEQVRREMHRIDGRTDIWALGIMLYELLSGRQPFRSSEPSRLEDEICNRPAQPPRQRMGGDVSPVLENICLRAISKKRSDRFPTASDFSSALRDALRGGTQPAIQQERVIFRGLSPYEQRDAGFFLQLLPGPRRESGLPDSIEFWKERIENGRSASPAALNLLVGPPGCGKSSFIRAGLIPALSTRVQAVYLAVEPANVCNQIESRLKETLVGFDGIDGLPSIVRELREGSRSCTEKKTLIVLDQFERWLCTHREGHDSGIADAIRQSDGIRVQFLLMVSDKFWAQVSSFAAGLDVTLQEGVNQYSLMPFHENHAEDVLIRLGRSYGRLPVWPDRLNRNQTAFVGRIVSKLSRRGPILPRRLAELFHVLRDVRWQPGTVKKMNGIDGIFLAFLDEVFISENSIAFARGHLQAIVNVLEGFIRVHTTLDQALSVEHIAKLAGFDPETTDCTNLLHFLTNDTGIIALASGTEDAETDQRYRLSHDYLAAPIATWVRLIQRKTLKGRARYCLDDRTRHWQLRRESQQLPTLIEYGAICVGVSRRAYSPRQAEMMRTATSHHLKRLLAVVAIATVTLISLAIYRARMNRKRAEALVEALESATLAEIPARVSKLADHRRWSEPAVRNALQIVDPKDEEAKFRFQLALLRLTGEESNQVLDRVLDPESYEQVGVLCRSNETNPFTLSGNKAVGYLHSELLKSAKTCGLDLGWWTPPRESMVTEIENAAGTLSNDAALCHSLPLSELSRVLEGLRDSGYRPLQIRPWLYQDEVRVAIVWTRDHRQWSYVVGSNEREIEYRNSEMESEGLQPIDAAVLPRTKANEEPSSIRFSVIWSEQDPKMVRNRVLISANHESYQESANVLRSDGYTPLTFVAADGMSWCTSIWTRGESVTNSFAITQEVNPDYFSDVPGLIRISQHQGTHSPSQKQRFSDQNVLAKEILNAVPTDSNAEFLLARARYYLYDHTAASSQLASIIRESASFNRYALPLLSVSLAHTGKMGEAREAFERLARLFEPTRNTRPWQAAYLKSVEAKILAASNRVDDAVELIDDLLDQNDRDEETLFYAACAYSSISASIAEGGKDPKRSEQLAENAINLLREAIGSGFSNRFRLRVTPDLEAVRNLKEYAKLVGMTPSLLYSGIWMPELRDNTKSFIRLHLDDHVDKSVELIRQGYYPISLAVNDGDQHPLASSVWMYPSATSSDDYYLLRSVNAIAGLAVLNDTQPMWDLLSNSTNSTSIAELTNRLEQFRLGREVLIDRLLDSDSGSELRRSLLIALGNYDPRALKQYPNLSKKLIQIYADDPNPGVHSAAERLLRNWNIAVDNVGRPFAGEPASGRRPLWSKQERSGLVFAELRSRGSAVVGSTEFERHRQSNETLQTMELNHTFHLSTTEVTRHQFEQFQSGVGNADHTPAEVSWFEATAYCNWLSEQEGIPPDQWCYAANVDGEYGPGMTVFSNVADRGGYRLPTEVEWEFACRAGTRTPWHFGSSPRLLESYSWHYMNSGQVSHEVGQLCPNPLGLFDMSGNIPEWCHDVRQVRTSSRAPNKDRMVQSKDRFPVRGGGYRLAYPHTRSASRMIIPVGSKQFGFRVARSISPGVKLKR